MLPKPILMEEEELSFDLPEDVILKILCWLPVKSLIQFSCVSKRWRSIIIFDPQFGKAHLKLASELGTISRSLLLFQRPKCFAIISPNQIMRIRDNSSKENVTSMVSLANLFRDDCSVRNLNFPCNENITKVMASCNGLLLLQTDYKDFSVWNPSTGFFRKLPAVPHIPGRPEWWTVVTAHYGFGYVSSADDYRLVFLETCKPRLSGDVNMFIFSVKLNSWKVIKVSGWLGTRQSGIYLNGAIHWFYDTFLERPRPQTQIYAFDLANEKSRQFPGPHFNLDDNRVDRATSLTMQTVVHLGGCLCILYQTWYSVTGMEIELWKMTDYGVSDSWMKFFKFIWNDLPDVFELNRHSDWEPIFLKEDGTFVIKLPKTKELVRLECRQGEKPVCRDRYRLEELPGYELLLDNVTLYDETLPSVTQSMIDYDDE